MEGFLMQSSKWRRRVTSLVPTWFSNASQAFVRPIFLGALIAVMVPVCAMLLESPSASQTVPGCTPPPPNMVSWWPGDGNPNDIWTGGNNGTPEGDLTYLPGEVAQAFEF